MTHQFDGNCIREFSFRNIIKRWVPHGIQGFDYEKAIIDLEIPDNVDCYGNNCN